MHSALTTDLPTQVFLYKTVSRTMEGSGFSCLTAETPALRPPDFATASKQANDQCLVPLPSEYSIQEVVMLKAKPGQGYF